MNEGLNRGELTRHPEPGIYEHFKSTPENRKYYEVLGVGVHTETGVELVIYEPLYELPKDVELRILVRPVSMFTEDVRDEEGSIVPRFKYVSSVDEFITG